MSQSACKEIGSPMNSLYRRPFRLFNKVRHYDWGTTNAEAFIPRFLGIPVVPDLPYAELWIGAHPGAPSDIRVEGRTVALNSAIETFPREILGEDVARRFDSKLPFLLKILSAAKALSIQTHPNKEQAGKLHAADPAHYPDDNHKPEIAIALESLSAIAGFRPAADIAATLPEYPELDTLVGGELRRNVLAAGSEPERIAALKLLYGSIMRLAGEEAKLSPVIASIVSRLSGKNDPSAHELLFVEQYRLHGTDVGLFSFLFFNVIRLGPGQAIFTDAGAPHAYLKGNIVECMANSDNVVRAGLTGKFKDVNVLLDILTYRFAGFPVINEEQRVDGVVYRTGAGEFEITRYQKEAGFERMVSSGNKPAVVLVTGGALRVQWEREDAWESERFVKGESFLIPALLSRWRMLCEENSGFYVVEVP